MCFPERIFSSDHALYFFYSTTLQWKTIYVEQQLYTKKKSGGMFHVHLRFFRSLLGPSATTLCMGILFLGTQYGCLDAW